MSTPSRPRRPIGANLGGKAASSVILEPDPKIAARAKITEMGQPTNDSTSGHPRVKPEDDEKGDRPLNTDDDIERPLRPHSTLTPHRPPPTSGVSIASGAHVPRIDLEALFSQFPPESLAGAAMTGGGAQTRPAEPRAQTVTLADGTRISFAAPDWLRTLDSA